MFRDQITSKLCMSARSAFGKRAFTRKFAKSSEANIILEVPDTAMNDANCMIPHRSSGLSWIPVTEVLALTCLYLLVANPFG